VALLVANRNPSRVARLMLISPAFQVVGTKLAEMAGTTLDQWKADGHIKMTHHIDGAVHRLGIQLLQDASKFDFDALEAPVPTLIVHGTDDEVIPIRLVERWVANHPGANFFPLKGGDHSLSTCFDAMWVASRDFLLGF